MVLRLSPTLLPLVLAACGTSLPPAMAPAGATPDARDSLVFLRPRSACDTGDYTVVVDDAGKFVANVAPGARVGVALPPGPHVLYAWSSRDVRYDKEPTFNPVSATRVQAAEGAARYLELRVLVRSDANKNRCYPYAPVAFHHVPAGAAGEMLATTEPMRVADPAAGQADLEGNPERLKEHLAYGAQRLERREEVHDPAGPK
jgi:hypothetical protein